MRKSTLALIIAGVVVAAMLLLSVAQNEGCLPWQEPVGTEGSPFSGTKDTTVCR